MGVLAMDDMHLIATNGRREKLDYLFGYGQTFEEMICYRIYDMLNSFKSSSI